MLEAQFPQQTPFWGVALIPLTYRFLSSNYANKYPAQRKRENNTLKETRWFLLLLLILLRVTTKRSFLPVISSGTPSFSRPVGLSLPSSPFLYGFMVSYHAPQSCMSSLESCPGQKAPSPFLVPFSVFSPAVIFFFVSRVIGLSLFKKHKVGKDKTNTRTHTQARSRTHTHTHTRARARAHTHTRSHAHLVRKRQTPAAACTANRDTPRRNGEMRQRQRQH